MSENWYPLQSNPEVLNPYMKDLGIDIEKYSLHQVYSFEDWAIEMIP